MPIVKQELTEDQVVDTLTRLNSVSYFTDDTEAITEHFGLKRNMTGPLMGHLKRLTTSNFLDKTPSEAKPYRLHDVGGKMVPVKKIVYTVR